MSSPSPTRRASDAWPPWRRTLLIAFGAQTLALMGFTLIFPFLPLYIQTLGVHGRAVPAWAGIISFSGALPLVVMGPVWGALGDRYGRKPMVIRAMASGAVTMGLLIVAPNIWVLVALLMLSGLLTGVNAPLQALVTTVTPRAEMGRSMGLMLAAIFTGVALGPLAGGGLNDHLGFRGTFACSAGLPLAVAGRCAALASWLAPRLIDRYGYRRVLIGGLGLAGLLYLPAFGVQAVWQMVLVRAGVGLALGSALPAAGAIVGLSTPAERRGAAYGLTSSAESCGFAVGPLLGGSLGALLGGRAVFPITAAALLGVAIVVARLVQEPQELGEGSDTQPVAAARLSAK